MPNPGVFAPKVIQRGVLSILAQGSRRMLSRSYQEVRDEAAYTLAGQVAEDAFEEYVQAANTTDDDTRANFARQAAEVYYRLLMEAPKEVAKVTKAELKIEDSKKNNGAKTKS